MGIEIQSKDTNDNSVQEYADRAKQRMLLKKAEYEAAKEQEAIFSQLKSNAESKFKSISANYMEGMDSSEYDEARANYNSAISSYTDASNNTDLIRSSYQHSIFYAGKMGNSAIIASAILKA